MNPVVLNLIRNASVRGRKLVALLIDPDSFSPDTTPTMIGESGADLIFVGGSLISKGDLEETVLAIRSAVDTPVILFPGSILQITPHAHAILNLSLISGRNSEFLIGQHVIAAPLLKASKLEIIPTGYMLIDSGKQTTASYISGTVPIPHDKSDIAACTAMAGEMLGLSMIYLDGGSGAQHTISENMVQEVKKNTTVPLVVGGGIRTCESAQRLAAAGADMLVIGNVLQENPSLARKIVQAIHSIHVQV